MIEHVIVRCVAGNVPTDVLPVLNCALYSLEIKSKHSQCNVNV